MRGDEDSPVLGDPFLLGDEFKSISQSEVARAFGDAFARAVFGASPGAWIGPVRSGYGAHFIFIDERAEGTVPPLEKVRRAVEREWINEKKAESEQKFYQSLRDRYEIVVEPINGDTTR